MKTVSKFHRQRMSKLWGLCDKLDRFSAEDKNTSSWVDEGYAKRLTRLLKEDAKKFKVIPHDITTLMKESFFLAMVSFKDDDALWGILLEVTKTGDFALAFHEYDKLGYRVKYTSGILCRISQHAMTRLFERRRTNAFLDLGHILRDLTALFVRDDVKPEFIGEEADFVLPKFGTFHAVATDTHGDTQGPGHWVMKTYIDKDN